MSVPVSSTFIHSFGQQNWLTFGWTIWLIHLSVNGNSIGDFMHSHQLVNVLYQVGQEGLAFPLWDRSSVFSRHPVLTDDMVTGQWSVSLVWSSKHLRPFGQVVNKHICVLVSFVWLGKLHDINTHPIIRPCNRCGYYWRFDGWPTWCEAHVIQLLHHHIMSFLIPGH